ncbi:uncharacterized protein LOC123895962 [Trifolium pratense]|uniref:uncharacterized protein LOC123895962 n=1 Tax=Trifolium pratense TaxID=57577 RepID=UPI001E694A23|nr:uncharacterized protein LOC123895962 [Trifolium pratense]
MGFRDLHAFNLAMIAKQAWNIMTKPHSLVARLYKARYFPNSSLLDSHIGHNPSYAWCGIRKSRHILMNGCRWIIGSGTNINVMKDPWLREKGGTWIHSPQAQGAYNINVNNLMLPNIKRWDKEKIETLFTDEVAKCILDIPLVDTVEGDKLIWIDNNYGQYSVRSSYNLVMNNIGKMKNTVQQEIGITFGKFMLHRRSSTYFGGFVKNVFQHVFVFMNDEFCQRYHSFHCTNDDADTAGMFAMLLWVLWNNINNKVWNDSQEIGRNLGYQARQLWLKWFSMQRLQQGSTHNVQQQVLSWQKPPTSWHKCNNDAGFHNNLNKTSDGWCLRDHLGNFVLEGTNWRERQCSIVEGESLALLEAMKAIEHRGLTHVIFETDSQDCG